MRNTVSVKKYWLVYIFAQLSVMSMVNITRGAEPMGKVTLHVQILESLHLEGTHIMFGWFQIDP
jgi:hypothetical protein